MHTNCVKILKLENVCFLIEHGLLLICSFIFLYLGNTSGLLGFWDGNRENEFLLPNGTTLDTNSSQSVIHYEFGQLCKYWNV